MRDDQYPAWPDLFRWLTVLKDRVETLPSISAEQVITGTLDPSLIPPIPWDGVLKAGSSLGDLEIRSASDLLSGTLSGDRMPGLSGDVSSTAGTVVTTLATVNTSPGTFGSGTAIPIISVNGKGLVTSVIEQPIQTGALTRVNDTNVTATLGGTPATALLKDVSITLGWTGTLDVTRGGTGTGTAFTVGSVVFAGTSGIYAQDNANLFWDDTNNRLGIATATPLAKLQVLDTVATSPRGILSSQISTDTAGARVGFSKARGALGGETIVVTGDTLGRLMFRGYDGANYLEMASIEVGVSGTVALTRVPTFLAFSTATNAAPSVLTERMRIDSAGNVGIGTTSAGALGKVEVYERTDGFISVVVENDSTGTGAAGRFLAHNGGSAVGLEKIGASYSGTGAREANFAVLFDSGAGVNIAAGAAAGVVRFYTAGSASTNERARITATGNFGIGTTTPDKLLDVAASSSGGIGGIAQISNTAASAVSNSAELCFRSSSAFGSTFKSARIAASMTNSSSNATDLLFYTYLSSANPGGIERVRILSTGNVGIGVATPLAVLHLKAGTATANTAPLKFNSGTLLTTAEAGAVEFLTDAFYGTITTGAARKTFAFLESPAFTTPDIGAATGTSLAITGAIGKYKNVNTTGWGLPAIYGTGRSTAQVAAVASVATYTNGAADGSFHVSANVNVTTSTTHSFSVQVDYTDETNTAQTLTLTFSQLTAALVSVITNVTGAGPYEGLPVQIRCKASTAITVKTTGTFTTVTYNVEGLIQQVS